MLSVGMSQCHPSDAMAVANDSEKKLKYLKNARMS